MQIVCNGCATTTSVCDSRRRFCSWECYCEWRKLAQGKLNRRLAARVRKLNAAGMSARSIATAMAVGNTTIRRIIQGKHWTQR